MLGLGEQEAIQVIGMLQELQRAFQDFLEEQEEQVADMAVEEEEEVCSELVEIQVLEVVGLMVHQGLVMEQVVEEQEETQTVLQILQVAVAQQVSYLSNGRPLIWSVGNDRSERRWTLSYD
jgi:hypothetical protein